MELSLWHLIIQVENGRLYRLKEKGIPHSGSRMCKNIRDTELILVMGRKGRREKDTSHTPQVPCQGTETRAGEQLPAL